MTTQFDNIYHELNNDIGKFRIASSGMAWMNNQTKDTVPVSAGDIKWAQWFRVARNYRLRVGLKDNRRRESFDGFIKEDHDKLSNLLRQHFGIVLENKEVSFKGWNWGVTDFQGQDLAFLVSNKTSFELPLNNVANSNIAGRTEVSLEFSTASSKIPKFGDEMVEIRFHVPGSTTKETGSDAGSKDEDMDDEREISAAQAFHDLVKEKADLGEVSGDVIVNFEEILVVTPRGRYDVDMFPDFLRLRGKTYDYKINYDGISRLFLLPKDDQQVLFILCLINPIRQGQTRYQFLIMQFDRSEELTAELNIKDEDLEKYDKLQRHYEMFTYEVVSSIFRALSGKKIIGSGSFKSRSGHPGMKANLKAVQGDLFILEKSIFFVAKAPLLIELSDIQQVMFSRVGGAMASSRSFDLKITTKSGPEHTFTSINKEEHEPLESYLKEKKIRVKNQMNDAELAMAALEDDDDDEVQSVVSSGEEVIVKSRNDDDDTEEDEDFQASSSDEGSPSSDSDSSGEGADVVSDASGDRELVKPKKKKADGDKNTKKPVAKKAKDLDEDAMDVDNDQPKAKPRPKPKPKVAKDNEDEPAKKKQKTDSK